MVIFYFGWKLVKKTKMVPLDQVPVSQFIRIADANPEPEPTVKKGPWAWFGRFWWD
jgi:amino acid transporter